MKRNVFDSEIPKEVEIMAKLLDLKNVKIERIVSSGTAPDITFEQTQDEWVLLLKGRATLDMNGSAVEVKEGEDIFIPAGQKHRIVEVEKGTVWLAVHIS